MKRSLVNFIIDLISFINLIGLAFTGFVLKSPHRPGGLRHQFRGGHDGAEQISDFWSMTRLEWGSIHFYLAVAFIILMIAHIIMHWDWIKNCFKSHFGFSSKTHQCQIHL